MILLVLARQVFETPKVIPAIEHAEGFGIDLGYGDVEMRTAVLDVANNEARPFCADPELVIDRFQESGKLRGHHFPFWRNREVPHGVTAAFHGSEGMSIVERGPVAGQYLDALILVRFVEQMTGEIMDAAFAGDACCLTIMRRSPGYAPAKRRCRRAWSQDRHHAQPAFRHSHAW